MDFVPNGPTPHVYESSPDGFFLAWMGGMGYLELVNLAHNLTF